MRFLLFLLLILIQTPDTFASRSRMYSLGQDPHRGSYYVEDDRNIFRNPADVNLYKKYATMELEFVPKGDSALTLVPQGGYFTEIGETPVGVYLGQGLAEGILIEEEAFDATPSDLFLTNSDSNPVTFFMGGESGFEWGLDLRLANAERTTGPSKATYQALSASLGLNIGELQIYGNYGFRDKSQVRGSDIAQNGVFESSGYITGVIYRFTNVFFLADLAGGNMDLSGRSVSDENGKIKVSRLDFGIGHLYELDKTKKFNFNLNYVIFKTENDVKDENTTETNLPLVIGMEMEALSWLIFRASVAQNIVIGKKEIESNGTTITGPSKENGARVNFGATFNFGKLKVDGNLGMNNISLINLNVFFANASITYWY